MPWPRAIKCRTLMYIHTRSVAKVDYIGAAAPKNWGFSAHYTFSLFSTTLRSVFHYSYRIVLIAPLSQATALVRLDLK